MQKSDQEVQRSKQVIIREDDICYFTDPERVLQIHGCLIDRQTPISFAVIPNVFDSILLDPSSPFSKSGLTFDPLIAPKYRGRNEYHPVSENDRLVAFLKESGRKEVTQHGYTHEVVHGRPEFAQGDQQLTWRRIEAGRRILQQAFGSAPNFFVPPYDSLSKSALVFSTGYFSGIAVFRLGFSTCPFQMVPSLVSSRLRRSAFCRYGGCVIFEHPPSISSIFKPRGQMLQNLKSQLESHSVLVIVSHLWEYFFDWRAEPNADLLKEWRQVVEYLQSRDDVAITTFADVAKGITSGVLL